MAGRGADLRRIPMFWREILLTSDEAMYVKSVEMLRLNNINYKVKVSSMHNRMSSTVAMRPGSGIIGSGNMQNFTQEYRIFVKRKDVEFAKKVIGVGHFL